jgi:hypothetical protein
MIRALLALILLALFTAPLLFFPAHKALSLSFAILFAVFLTDWCVKGIKSLSANSSGLLKSFEHFEEDSLSYRFLRHVTFLGTVSVLWSVFTFLAAWFLGHLPTH